MKKSFTLLELIFTIVIIAIVSSIIIPKPQYSNLDQAAQRIILYLKHIRYLALVDNKYSLTNNEWFKARWTLKFQNCSNDEDGLYFVVYSDESGGTAHFKKSECAKDPITSKYLYSSSSCISKKDESKYILLTKEYGITRVAMTCNETSTIGKISFGERGNIYSLIGTLADNILTETCYIKLFDKDGKFVKIAIEPQTGFVHQK